MTETKLKTKAEHPPKTAVSAMPASAPWARPSTASLSSCAAPDARKIYREKVTGAHNDRRELLKMLKHLAPGDVVTVTRIDRLARSTFDLFAIVKQIVDAKAQFRSLAEPWADTGTSTGRLMIAVLGGLADVERDLIRTRTAEGRSRAQKRGQRMGRQTEIDRGAAGRGPQAAGGRCHTCRTRAQLRRRQEHDFEAPGMSDVILEELDIDYHLPEYVTHIAAVNKKTAMYFTHQAQQTHSLVVKNALNNAQTSAVMIAQNLSEQARPYILYGAARRLGMMRVSYCDILRCIATDRIEPLASDEAATVERDLNIIYINIRGVLDNYAWCLLHQTTTDKTRKLAPTKVGLFSKEFTADANLVDLRPKLCGFSAWHTELKGRRDPAAHRIPLSVPPCLLNQKRRRDTLRWNCKS